MHHKKSVRALALHMFFCIIYIVYKYIGTTRSQFVHWPFIRPNSSSPPAPQTTSSSGKCPRSPHLPPFFSFLFLFLFRNKL